MSLPKINLVVIGHKDHGKSTLIGRLLYDSEAIREQKLQEIKNELKESGKKEFEFAFLLDSLEEERKGGLSIDIVQTPFKSKKYFYTIIDCPGHREFIKKMLTGASQADAAVLVVSAKEGIQDQTRQHAFLIKTLGIDQLVVAVNKMDEMAYKQSKYDETCRKLRKILGSLGYEQIPMIPVSAMTGDNVFTASKKVEWYKGLTLIETLDKTINPSTLPINKPLRGFVQDIYRHESEEIIICKVETGILETGKVIRFNPSGKEGLLKAIEAFGTRTKRAEPGDSVGLSVGGINDIERGEVISYTENRPRKVKSFVAEIILFSDIEIRNGDTLTIRVGTAEKKCEVQRILNEIDPINLTVRMELPEFLAEESVGEVVLFPLEPLCVEKYSEFPPLGRFVVEGKKGTAGAGLVLEVQ
jgi:elongation factor 1-alpha